MRANLFPTPDHFVPSPFLQLNTLASPRPRRVQNLQRCRIAQNMQAIGAAKV